MKRKIVIPVISIVVLFGIGGLIMSLFLTKLEHIEPGIITLDQPIQFVGLSVNTNMKTIYKDAAQLGKDYSQYKKEHSIPNLKDPWTFVAYSRDFDEAAQSWEYIMGDVVTGLDSIPEGLNGYKIPAATYAVFLMQPKLKCLWGLEMGRMKKFVFSQWLPGSDYRSTGEDFELHDARSLGKHPSIDLYVAVVKKVK